MKRESKIRAMNSKNLTDPGMMLEPLACSLCSFLSRAWATREASQGRVVWALQNPTLPPKASGQRASLPGQGGEELGLRGLLQRPFQEQKASPGF